MKFKLNHFYRHKMGRSVAVLCETETHAWGKQLIIEETDPTGQAISCVSPDENHKDWAEISLEEWTKALGKDHTCCACSLMIAVGKEYRFIPNKGLIHEDCYQSIKKEYESKENA